MDATTQAAPGTQQPLQSAPPRPRHPAEPATSGPPRQLRNLAEGRRNTRHHAGRGDRKGHRCSLFSERHNARHREAKCLAQGHTASERSRERCLPRFWAPRPAVIGASCANTAPCVLQSDLLPPCITFSGCMTICHQLSGLTQHESPRLPASVGQEASAARHGWVLRQGFTRLTARASGLIGGPGRWRNRFLAAEGLRAPLSCWLLRRGAAPSSRGPPTAACQVAPTPGLLPHVAQVLRTQIRGLGRQGRPWMSSLP